jgi:hypothetical protein
MFLFVGGLVGLVQYFLGVSPALLPWTIILGGLGAVFCVELLFPQRE